MLHLRRGGYEFAILHAFGGDEFAGDLVDFVAPASNDDHFKTVVFIQMDVQAGIYGNFGFVLHIREKSPDSMDSMVVNQIDHADYFGIALAYFFLNQMIANQIANRLGAVLITDISPILRSKCGQQILL